MIYLAIYITTVVSVALTLAVTSPNAQLLPPVQPNIYGPGINSDATGTPFEGPMGLPQAPQHRSPLLELGDPC